MNEVAELSRNERIAERELAGKDHSREISQYEEDAAGIEWVIPCNKLWAAEEMFEEKPCWMVQNDNPAITIIHDTG